jgi:hypothetical protein
MSSLLRTTIGPLCGIQRGYPSRRASAGLLTTGHLLNYRVVIGCGNGNAREIKTSQASQRQRGKNTIHTVLGHPPYIQTPMENIDPSRCCLDSFRLAIATQLSRCLGITVESAYDGVHYGKKGADFSVAVPQFRLKSKPGDLVQKVIAEVCRNR